MKAIVYDTFGPPEVLHVEEIAEPMPKENEVKIRVAAASVGYGDITARNVRHAPLRDFHMPLPLYIPSRIALGIWKPRVRILGAEFAGKVVEVGQNVTRFKEGDAIFGYLGQAMGAYAEFVCVAENKCLAIKPQYLSFEEASVVPYGAIMALSLLAKAPVEAGQKVLINGASGGIGSAALQIARHHGAHVTGVCGSPRLDTVRSLGADEVIDYTREDFWRNGQQYDLIFDVLGKSSFEQCEASLTPQGRYLAVSFKMKQVWQAWRTSRSQGRKVIVALANEKPASLDFVRQMVEAGQYKVIVDKVYPMEQAAEAHRRVESGLRAGQVVISMAP